MKEILDVQNSLGGISGVYVHFGTGDFKPSQYPLIQLLPDQGIDFTSMNTNMVNIDIGMNIKIIVDKERELTAFNVLVQTLKTINELNDNCGNMLDPDGSITTEYTDNTYEISIPYIIKALIQNT